MIIGDYALDTDAGFLAVVEDRLILVRARSKSARVWRALQHSICSLACQDSGHVGHAGFGVVSLRGAPLSILSFSCAAFSSFSQGGLIRYHIPTWSGGIMHLVVVYGFHGAASDPEKLALT